MENKALMVIFSYCLEKERKCAVFDALNKNNHTLLDLYVGRKHKIQSRHEHQPFI